MTDDWSEVVTEVIIDHYYDPWCESTTEEKREWHVFALFLMKVFTATAKGARDHVGWLLQRPFPSVSQWMGEEGDKFRAIWIRYRTKQNLIGPFLRQNTPIGRSMPL